MLPLLFLAVSLKSLDVAKAQSSSPIEVPFEIHGSTIVVPAKINNRDFRFVFDTGFGGEVVIDDSIDLGKVTGHTMLRDFVGEFEAPIYKIKQMSLGAKEIKGGDMEAIGQPDASQFGEGTHVDGLMGFSVIKDSVTEISFQKKSFIFYPDSVDISQRKPDNKKTFLIPMLPIGSRAIELAVNTPDGKQMTMALDTGNAFYATTHKDVLERVGLWPANTEAKFMSQSGVASGPVNSWSKDLKNMKIFGVPVADSIWDVIDLPSSESTSDGTVGFEFLKNFNITFDYKRRYVWLENFTGEVSDPADGDPGISAFYIKSKNQVRILHVSEGSPAALAGIKEGDLLLAVDDDEELTNISYYRLRKLLHGTVGTKLKLSVSRDGIAKRYTLTRAALVNP